MKNLSFPLVVLAVSVFLVLTNLNAFAEPYKNSNFPPNEIIEKNYNTLYSSANFINLLGKFEIQENAYTLYIHYGSKKETGLEKIPLKKLDSNIWIFKEQFILQQ